MYYNLSQMEQLRKWMSHPRFEHELVAGDILHSVLRYEDNTHSDHVMCHQHKTHVDVWNVEAMIGSKNIRFGGEVILPHYYTPRQTAAFFNTMCDAIWDEEYDALHLMIEAVKPDNMYETALLRLSQMLYVPGWTIRLVEEGSIEDWPGLRLQSDSERRAFNFVPNSPEEGLAHWTTLDWGKNELDHTMMEWAYDTDDVVAVRQTVYALLAQSDKVLSDRLDMAQHSAA